MPPDQTPMPPRKSLADDDAAARSTPPEGGAVSPDTRIHAELAQINAESGESWIGKKLGKYHVTDILGRGGSGLVLKAHDESLERDVAIKVLSAKFASNSSGLARFLAEAKSAAKISHPNVVQIYEVAQDGNAHYFVLELVPGGSLEDLINHHKHLSVADATKSLIDACKGVGAAHAVGLIHRDIKPANFMCAADGSIKVSDFGLAKSAGTGLGVTHPGIAVGTPFFMSPEQCRAQPLDFRADIYSLGATYYALLTGEYPYKHADSVPQLMYLHCHEAIPDPRAVIPTIPDACFRIIERAMAKSPDDRYQSTEQMSADLEAASAALTTNTCIDLPSDRYLLPSRSCGRRLAIVLGGMAIVAAITVALFLWRPWHKAQPAGTVLSGEPIKVGILHSLTGTMATSESPVVYAVVFAINEINEQGGILGRPVKGILADGASDDLIFAREAKRLIVDEKVCTVFGCWTSASRKSVKPIIEEYEHLLVYPVQFEGLETSPAIVYVGAAPNQQILPAIDWAINALKKKRFFLVGCDYVFPRAANAIISDKLKDSATKVVGEAYLPLGSQSVDEVVEQIKAAKPDMILNSINGDSNIAFFRKLRAAGIKSAEVPTLSFSICEQDLRSLKPREIEGDYASWTYFNAITSPENESFVRRFRERSPQLTVTDPMESAYIGVKLWAEAARQAESLEPKKIRRAFLDQRIRGPDGDVRLDADTQYCYRTPRIGQILGDGQFKIIWTANEPVQPQAYPRSRSAEEWRAWLHDLYSGWGNRWSAPSDQR